MAKDKSHDTNYLLEQQVSLEAKEFNSLDTDDFEQFLDYVGCALDIETVRDMRNRVTGVILTVALGGPNVTVDTRNRVVKGWWGWNSYENALNYEQCEWFNSQIEELDLSC
ncbi:hypothetical protein QP927_08545 [Corynebacterium pseudodiphtheriticum]|uniref:hypothetical protein n=1 Tax=Corynebacterium pseudodiphtheriticum TaxID=37637 RepID=UPI00254DE87D|nr:hypothetical protein [Corynebacterium pseudodiphtheriticum]MDK8478913.1 hypothetical protein [Corynebacterium pseudodiphtheriticum]